MYHFQFLIHPMLYNCYSPLQRSSLGYLAPVTWTATIKLKVIQSNLICHVGVAKIAQSSLRFSLDSFANQSSQSQWFYRIFGILDSDLGKQGQRFGWQ